MEEALDFTPSLDVARELVALCTERSLTVATAESLTAGLTSSIIASIPGASSVLRGGAATYTNDIKHRVLGVSEETLATWTAVSSQTACEMAAGARDLFQSDVAVSLTGYAGPDGGEDGTPAGTVYLGIADAAGVTAERHTFPGGRNEVRLQAARRALELLLEHAKTVPATS